MMRWPSATVAFSSVRRYMDAMAWLSLSFSRDWRLAPPRSTLGTWAAPRQICGTSSVKAAACPRSSPSTPASRFRKPEP